MSIAYTALLKASEAALVSDFRELCVLAVGARQCVAGEQSDWFSELARSLPEDLADNAYEINAVASRYLAQMMEDC